jgi:hypothetical protein
MWKKLYYTHPTPSAPGRAPSRASFSSRRHPECTPEGIRLGLASPAALLDDLFEHPIGPKNYWPEKRGQATFSTPAFHAEKVACPLFRLDALCVSASST